MKQVFHIVGMKHRGPEAERIVALAKSGDPAVLIREPLNPYDPRAVQVWMGGLHVAYIRGSMNTPLAEHIDRNGMAPVGDQPGPRVVASFAVTADRWPSVEIDL